MYYYKIYVLKYCDVHKTLKKIKKSDKNNLFNVQITALVIKL